jgi:hypothetical protein
MVPLKISRAMPVAALMPMPVVVVARRSSSSGFEDLSGSRAEFQGASFGPQPRQTDHEQHIADARGDERLDRRLARGDLVGIGVVFIVPEADQQVGAKPHDLPRHKEEQ